MAFIPAFNALFRNGSKTKEVDLGLTLEEVQKLDKKFFAEGFQMRFLVRYIEDGSYQVAWEHGEGGAQFWIDTDDFDEFKSKDKKHFNDGLRLRYLRQEGGRFAAIWRTGSGAQFWEANIGFNDFKAKDEEFRKQGLMLMHFCDEAGKYTGYWQAGKKDYSWISTDHTDGFKESITINKDRGRLAVSFGGDQFCVVYHEDTGDQRFVNGMLEKDFKKKTEELFKEGFHIADLYMTEGLT